jgi:hypothetical protein
LEQASEAGLLSNRRGAMVRIASGLQPEKEGMRFAGKSNGFPAISNG